MIADLLTIQDRALYELEVDPTDNAIRLAESAIRVNQGIAKLEQDLIELQKHVNIIEQLNIN